MNGLHKNLENLGYLMDQRATVNKTARGTEATIITVGDLIRIVECHHIGSYQYRGQRKVIDKEQLIAEFISQHVQ